MATPPKEAEQPVSRSYRSSIVIALASQAFLIVLSSVTLDGGQLTQWALLGSLAFWPVAILIVVRRPKKPTRGDHLFLRWGYLLLTPIVSSLTALRWMLFGS